VSTRLCDVYGVSWRVFVIFIACVGFRFAHSAAASRGSQRISARDDSDFGWFWTQGVGVGWYVAPRWGLDSADLSE
jgi:hypothetical protein